jgi:hypothetical protein
VDRRIVIATGYHFDGIFFLFFGSVNLIADYISVVETRCIIGLVRKHGFPYVLIVIDVLLTIIISFLFFCLGFAILYAFAHYGLALLSFSEGEVSRYRIALDHLIVLDKLPIIFIGLATEPKRGFGSFAGYMTISIHATFLTSIWLLLYLIADIATRFITRFHALRRFLDRNVVLEEHPLKVMALLLIALMTICVFGYLAISWAVGGNLWQ